MSIVTTSLYDCYEYIIGLSRTEGSCYDPKTGFEIDYNTSYSGLYLDEILPLSRMLSLEKATENVWYIANQCRDLGVKRFVRDGQQKLMQYYRLRNQPFKGSIGRIRHKKDRAITKDYAGVEFYCKDYKGAYLTVNNIGTIMSYAGTVDVTVYNNLGDTWGPYTLNCAEDTLTLNPITPLDLPLHDDIVDNLIYYFMYETAGGQPRDNDLSCNCGSFRPVFNPNKPYYTKSFSGRYGWANYVMIGGIETNDLEFEQEDYCASLMMNGLIFDVELRCHISGILCEDELDYEASPTAVSIAYAVLYASAIVAIERMFSDTRININKITDREYFIMLLGEFEKKYNENVEYIAKTIDPLKTDCIMCREPGAAPYRKPLLT